MTEKKVNLDVSTQKSISVDGITYTCPYTETEYVPDLKGPSILKQRRAKDCYEAKEITFSFFSGTSTLAQFLRRIDPLPGCEDLTEENTEKRARYYLALYYSDANAYSIERIQKEENQGVKFYEVVFNRKVKEFLSTDYISVWVDPNGALCGLMANDYQIYDGVEISTEQVNEAKARLDTAIAENGLISEGGLRVVMGDDGELYLSVQASYYEAHNEEVGVTILEELFTRL